MKEEKQFGLKYSESDGVQYLIVSFLANEDNFISNLIKIGQKISKSFLIINNYATGDANFKNSPPVRRRSKSSDRFHRGIRNSVNIELWAIMMGQCWKWGRKKIWRILQLIS